MKCNICPRECGADREGVLGFCGMPSGFVLARAAKHFWEEPPISGEKGSGTVFFSGCNLGCVFCQNRVISHEGKGKPVSDERLMEIFNELTSQGVHNINLVNPTHYVHRLIPLLKAYEKKVPFVYNCSGYEKEESIKALDGLIDIYLPDLKYISPERSERYSAAADYFDYASRALTEMKRQCPENAFDEKGIMQRGLILRHLVLPSNTNQSIKILDWIKENLGRDTAISLMSQYTPFGELEKTPEIQRRITKREYDKVVSYAIDLGFDRVYTQEISSASEDFIPDFDFSGA